MTITDKDGILDSRFSEIVKFRKVLSTETDRGCALFASAFLDEALKKMLSACLVNGPNMEKDIFTGPNSPLSTFSARIKISFYLGKISKSQLDDLNLIRKIRNEFAHSAEDINFSEDKISSFCHNLKHSWYDKGYSSRVHFETSCMALLSTIIIDAFNPVVISERKLDPLTEEMKNALTNKANEIIGENTEPVKKLFDSVVRGETKFFDALIRINKKDS